MSLTVVGLSHKTAPVELREKLAFSCLELEKILKGAMGNSDLSEMTILSTCNRTEIYCSSHQMKVAEGSFPSLRAGGGPYQNPETNWCTQFLANHFEREDLHNFLYTKTERDMVAHLFRVVSGLDSLVLGENEILKQVKDAYLLSQRMGLTGKLFNVLFQRALYVGKLVRTHTALAQGSLSVGSVAVSLAEKIFGDLTKSVVLIFGAGKMAEVSARYLLSKKVKKLLVSNRTVENARSLAQKFNAQPLSLTEGLEQMVAADIIIASASVSEPFILKKFVEELMLKRHNKSVFLIDIAVPRNVESSVHQIDNVYLYNIDDLQELVQENLKNRTDEMKRAESIIGQKTDEFVEWYHSWKLGEEKSLKHNVWKRGQAFPCPPLPNELHGSP